MNANAAICWKHPLGNWYGVLVTQKCIECRLVKEGSEFYASKRNGSGLEYVCKTCKRLLGAARRFHVSKEFIRWLYTHDTCMCCESVLDQGRQTHIHHTDAGVRGLVCSSCNYVLGQETEADVNRIKLCLTFMPRQRENLIDRVNQQESLKFQALEGGKVENPQRLARCGTQDAKICPNCGRPKTGRCKRCATIKHQVKVYDLSFELVKRLRSVQRCECCGCEFTKENKQCIHHVKVLHGVVCNRCNQILGDESELRRTQLLACVLWIEESMIQSDLNGNIERLAEMSSPAA